MWSRWSVRTLAARGTKALVGGSLLAAAQGVYFLTQYRLCHGDAPHPECPANGVVVVRAAEDHDESDSRHIEHIEHIEHTGQTDHQQVPLFQRITKRFGKQSTGDTNDTHKDHFSIGSIRPTRTIFHLFHKAVPLSHGTQSTQPTQQTQQTQPILERQLPPLQVFVVGDSLAVGVGTSKSGTPILPESIARHLSKELGGRPVCWTCMGTPGASTKRITVDIQKWFDSRQCQPSNYPYQPSHSTGSSLHDCIPTENYDVVVVLAGLNDLKGMVLPFLTSEEGKNNVTFKEGLRQIFFLLNDRLRWKAKPHYNNLSNDRTTIPSPPTRPLMVLPALPTLPIPLFQYPPLGWFAQTLLDLIDNEKRALMNEHPHAILYVDAPSSSLIQHIEKGTSDMCTHKKTERVLVALHDVKDRTKRRIEKLMQEHSLMHPIQTLDYNEKERDDHDDDDGSDYETENSCEEALHLNLMRKMPAFLGSKLVSVDKIHPNDIGYDYWGRHIAAAIMNEWRGASSKEEQ